MADITVTAGSVLASATALTASGTAGATITAGQAIYNDDSVLPATLKPADANDATNAGRVQKVVGIALNGGSTGQPIKYVYQDDNFTPGATLTVGETYIASANPGSIAPIADAVTGWVTNVLFVAKTAAVAVLKIVRGGVAKP